MCLFKIQKTYKIADKDIECYKALSSDLRSQYYNWQYELNKFYSKKWDEKFIKYADSHHEIGGNAFHACLSLDSCKQLYGTLARMTEITDDSGEKELVRTYDFSSDQVCVKCIIPKGTRYYHGAFTEVACENIYIKEICQL